MNEKTIEILPISREEIEDRKAYLDFTERDLQALTELKPIIEDNLDYLVEGFYQKLLKWERTRAFFKDEATVNRLKLAQRNYLMSLVAGEYDEDYFQSRVKIGKIHNIIKLIPWFYLGAYNLYHRLIYPLIFRAYYPDSEKIEETILALDKIMNLDTQLAMETYFEAYKGELTQLNQQLEEANKYLEMQVAKRTEELERKNQELSAINSDLEAFVYTVSHDLKAPILTMHGFTNLLLESYSDCLDDKGKDYLDRISKNVKRMDSLIGNLLKLSRIRYETHEYAEVSFQKIIEEACETLHKKLVDSGMEVVLREPLPTIYCDEIRLTEVMVNLLDNAIKYRKVDAQGRVEVSARETGHDHEFCVRDNGTGVDPEYADKVFELFQCFHEGCQGESTGVGLSIVKRIIEKHRGKVWLESKMGEGAAFFFTLPKK
ncbi:MAG: GHKL domain-containing protein [Candidatus Tectomicrobia bacterium]|uniref:histidine kinase n=1 Tax=Tectimicrobiota bacterium TaxID=2528274 RepID=A0A933GLK2_UNCTE|nr:GHKL domain-containing protein [Candidatus Tectomicrobia bacterium]